MKILALISISRLAVVLLQLACVKIYSNYLSNHELGIYYFLIALSYSLNALLFVPIDYYQQSKIYVFIKEGVSLRSIFLLNKRFLKLFLSICGILTLVLLTFDISYAKNTIMAIGLALSIYLGNSLKGILNNLENRSLVAGVMAFEALLKFCVLYLIAIFFVANSATLISSTIIATTVAMLPLIYYVRKLNVFQTGRIERINGRDVFIFALPIAIGAIFNLLQLQSYRIVLVPLGMAEMVGVFATVAGIGQAGMGAVIAVYSQIFLPSVYKSEGRYIGPYIRNGLLLYVFVILICFFTAPLVVPLFTKDEFKPFAYLIIYGVLIEMGNFVIGALGILLSITNQTKKGLLGAYVSMLVMVVCFLVLYSTGDINEFTIGLPLVLSQLVAALVLYWIVIIKKINHSGNA
jgi:O-antigen/teichoic acid export membrane protein